MKTSVSADVPVVPRDWDVISVGKVATIENGCPFKSILFSDKEGLPLIRIRDVNAGRSETFYAGPYDAKYIVRNGDILIGMDGEFRCRKWKAGIGLLNQRVCRLVQDETRIDRDFLAWAVGAPLKHIEDLTPFTTVKHISASQIRAINLPFPPLAEQRKIAAILGLLERALEQQERLLELTIELKKTFLHQLFTQGIRGKSQKQTEIGPVPESWAIETLENAAISFDYGTSVKCELGGAGSPVLRIPNVVHGSIDLNELKYGQPKPSELEQLQLRTGDLLFVRTNGVLENAGRCALYRGEVECAYFASYLIRVRVDSSKVLPAFVNEYAKTERGRSFLSGRAIRTADGKFNINSGTLKRVLIPLPSLDEQTEMVRQVDLVERKLNLHKAKLHALTDLFRALLHQLMTARIRVHDLNLPELEE
jgi:type I restriction enzyme S subunit